MPTSNGCSGTAQTFTITVNPTPTVAAIASQQLCAGQATTAIHFTGNVAGTTFRWLNNNSSIGLASAGVGDIPSFTTVNTGNITSTATVMVAPFTATCFGTAQSFTFNVNPLPQLTSTTTPNAICDSAIFNYEPSANIATTTFSWARAAVPGISNAAATGTGNPNEMLDNTTALPVQVTYVYTLSANGCSSSTYNVVVTVNPRPKLTSDVSLQSICDSTLFSYTPTSNTPGTSFAWIRVAVPGISNTANYGKDNPDEILDNNTNVPVSIIYAYTLSAGKCYNTYNVNVTVNPKLALTGNTTPTSVCSGRVFQYTPTGTVAGITYTWARAAVAGISNAAATGTNNINETLINTTSAPVNVTYVYTLSYNGCAASYNITVTVNPAPSLNITPANQELCAGQSTNTIQLTGPVVGTVYNWRNSNTDIGLAASGTGTIASFVAKNPYVESIGGTITIDPITPAGCTMSAPATISIKVNATPVGTLTAPLGTTLCTGSGIPVVATGGTTYQWYQDGNMIAGATAAQLIATSGGTYTVSATTAFGCSVQQSGNVKITALVKPTANFDFSSYCVNVPVIYTDKSTITNSGTVSYLWADNVGNTSTVQSPVITYTQTGNVVMRLKVMPQLCPLLADSISKTLAIEAPQAGQTLPAVNTTANALTQLNARNIGNTSYLWVPSTGLSNATIQNPVATISSNQQYIINMGMASGCNVGDTLAVVVRGQEEIFIPNMITPNGDGKNDQLVVVGIEKYPNSTMLIFNRWGNQVYRSNNYDNKWDGNGLAEGTYYYVLKLRLPSGDEKEFKGWVLLNRGGQ
ncbi:MAG: gliding motility-associated C-terminal domain-containing protein [Filimonas sp.]|nr:gliding motility-associated C-terminal domain-containing protein [Filimonas sp.]